MYKKILSLTSFLLCLFIVNQINANPKNVFVVLINNYPADLRVIEETSPPTTITLKQNQRKHLKFKVPKLKSEIYISAYDTPDKFAFFGVSITRDGNIDIHGYLSQSVSFSWELGGNTATITFCSQEDYSRKNGCN